MKTLIVMVVVAGLLVGLPLVVLAGDVEVHGFVEGAWSVRAQDEPQGREAADYLLNEARAQLRFGTYGDYGEAFVRLDVTHDQVGVGDDVEFELRGAFFRFTTAGDKLDVKLGRQPLTWGTGDLLFVNDLFPKDWMSFFIGREDQYLKAPVDAVRLGIFGLPFNVDIALMPEFTPDRTPTGERLVFEMPGGIAGVPQRPDGELDNGEAAIRLSKYLGRFDVALYGYRGFFPTPEGVRPIAGEGGAKATAELAPYYPKLDAYGASVRGALFGGVASVEGAFYRSREDGDGDDPRVPNSTVRHIAGLERQMAEDFTVGVQHFGEYMVDHDLYAENLGDAAADEYRQLVALRLEKMLHYQTVRLSLFTFWSPTDEDGHGRALMTYKVNDNVEVALGANIFEGESAATMFGRLDDNDNIYTRVRYSF